MIVKDCFDCKVEKWLQNFSKDEEEEDQLEGYYQSPDEIQHTGGQFRQGWQV